MLQPGTSWQQYEREVEEENERQKAALAAFHKREQEETGLWHWLKDRMRWLRWFSWS